MNKINGEASVVKSIPETRSHNIGEVCLLCQYSDVQIL